MFTVILKLLTPRMMKYGAIAIGIIVMVGYVYMKINSLNSKIDGLQASVKQLENKLNVKRVELINRDNVIVALNSSIDDMTATIDESNRIIEQQAIDIKTSKDKLHKWMNKPPEVKYKTIYKTIHSDVIDFNQATCKEGIDLNKDIAGLKYEDL